MGLFKLGKQELVCFLIRLETVDLERYNAIRKMSREYAEKNASNLYMMNKNISGDKESFITRIINLFKGIKSDDVSTFLSNFTYLDLREALATAERMNSAEKIDYMKTFEGKYE